MSVLTEAKETLLRALEQIEEAEADLDAEPTRADLCVVYSIGCKLEDEGGFHEIGGWSSTSGPEWLHAAMLRRAADARDASARSGGDEDE